jgi:hypothetical protein
MTDVSSTPGTGTGIPRQNRRQEVEPTGWVGWIFFAGVMMVMLGSFHAIQGLVALFDDGYYLVGKNGLAVHVDYTTWGWVHLIAGVVIAAAGVGLFAGQMWARVIGVIVCFLSAILNIGFLSAYPIWSAIMITMDILVIWALTVHGSEVKAAVAD